MHKKKNMYPAQLSKARLGGLHSIFGLPHDLYRVQKMESTFWRNLLKLMFIFKQLITTTI